MPAFSVRLFGTFRVDRNGSPVDGLDAGRVQEILAYLLLWRGRPHSREQLAELLWPEGASDQPRKQLRQIVWRLRAALSREGDPEWLIVRPELIQVRPGPELLLDVDVFERAYALARSAPGRPLLPEQVRAVTEAVDLYRGDLLEGWYQDWCLRERDRLQTAHLQMIDR